MDYLLVGKVRWEKTDSAQSRVRVSPELIEVASSTTRWQQPFDAVLSDVFQVQGEIAGQGGPGARPRARASRRRRGWRSGRPGTSPPGTPSSGAKRRSKRMVEIEPTRPGARHRGLRAGGRTRLGLRAGLGAALAGLCQPLHQRDAHARRGRARARGGRAGAGPGTRRRRAAAGAGDVLRLHHRRVRQGPGAVRPGAARRPQQRRAASAARRCRSRAWGAGRTRSTS